MFGWAYMVCDRAKIAAQAGLANAGLQVLLQT